VLCGPAGERTVSSADFFTGYRRTARLDDELLTAIRIPLVHDRVVRFRKVGTRRAQAISKVVLAMSWRLPAGRRDWSDVRVAFGSVAEVPIRARRAEAALEGAIPSAEVADHAAAAARADVRPIDDVRSTAGYRRTVSGSVLRRVVLAESTD
jgi:CO/xanthine dehydrogenase FAD-binding subunit